MAGLWLSPKLESRFDKKPSKNAKISLNLTTWIINLFSRLELFGIVFRKDFKDTMRPPLSFCMASYGHCIQQKREKSSLDNHVATMAHYIKFVRENKWGSEIMLYVMTHSWKKKCQQICHWSS
jgi:hypothetical protein